MKQSQQPSSSYRAKSVSYTPDVGILQKVTRPSYPKGLLYDRKWTWVVGALLTIIFIFCYWKVFVALTSKWWNNDAYSYGFLIPWISLYLIWIHREKLFVIQRLPNYWGGLTILLFGLGMLVVGRAGGVISFQELSLVVTITGVVFLLLGTDFLSVLWFPIAYLLFMIPIWEFATEPLHFPLQNFSANIGVTLLKIIGISVYRQGVYIELPNITLEVAKVCSGVNYLLSVIAIGIPLAYLFMKRWHRRVLLICSAVIIAILTNGLRVAIIGILAYLNISQVLHGPYHILQAMSVSIIGFLALFIGTWFLSEKDRSSSATLYKTMSSNHHQPQQLPHKVYMLKYPSLLIAGVFLTIGAYLNFYQTSPVPLKVDMTLFPQKIGEWKGTNSEPDYKVFRTLGIDHELSKVYRSASGKDIKLYIGYYELQEQEKELVNFNHR